VGNSVGFREAVGELVMVVGDADGSIVVGDAVG